MIETSSVAPSEILMQAWLLVTHLGAASITVPIAGVMFLGFLLADDWQGLIRWALAMLVAIGMVLASKIAFMGWGVGSVSLDFTGISGHATLAAAIYPVWLGWLLAGKDRRLNRLGMVLGLMISMLVAWSRVVIHAHSVSEALAGWLLGAGVSLFSYSQVKTALVSRYLAQLAGAFLLFALSSSLSNYLPTRNWEVWAAQALSGHSRPYTRWDLMHGRITQPRARSSATES